MAKRKKHSFHCQKCGSECTIYKKGKAHRVLVCPECGVIATNPSVVGKIIKGVAKSVPFLGTAVSVGEELLKKDSKAQSFPPPHRHRAAHTMYYIEKAEHLR